MGKGSPQVTNTTQTYTANPLTQQAASQALAGAESAAAQPFQMPVAPVAGFTPTQNQAFGLVSGAQGQAQPYYNQANSYFNTAAQPLSQAAINQYYNPMASNVTSQLQNIFGEQNAQATGAATQTAGGVGADRIAVAQGDLANQQTLAAGQTYANLYQQALSAAQQQQNIMGQQGQNIAGLGTTAENTALSGANALLGTGNQQQAQNQAQLNAPYQNTLAQIAYQFQTPQYLAGIAGGLSGALGGTTNGQQTVTPPYPSPLSQILGIGTAGAGIYGALSGTGGGTGGTGIGPTSMNGQLTLPQSVPGFQMANSRGGAVYARGGEVDGYDDGGNTDNTNSPAIPGVTLPKIGGLEPIPTAPLPMTSGHSGPLTGGINLSPQVSQGSSGSGNSIGSEVGQAINIAKTLAPLMMKRGGVPHYDDGGGTNIPDTPDFDPSKPILGVPAPIQAPWPFNSAHNEGGKMVPNVPPIYSATGTDPNATVVRKGSLLDKALSYFGGSSTPSPGLPAPATNEPVVTPIPSPPLPQSDPRKTQTQKDVPDNAVKVSTKKYNTSPDGGKGTTDVNTYVAPTNSLPYPDALNRDVGQNATRSPWMALIKAGAAIASTPGPIGVALAHGLNAGADTLAGQRKELRSEQELNDKAQELYQKAQDHLDKYNKMTPYERASIAVKNRELDQSEETEVGSGKPITEMDVARVIDRMRGSPGSPYATMPYDQLREAAINAIKRSRGVTTGASTSPAPGSSPQTAMPLPVGGSPEVGKWYIGPSGKPQQWNG